MRQTRRQFLGRSSVLMAATWGLASRPAWAQAQARTAASVANPDLTTLAKTFAPVSESGYSALGEAPGWPFVVREELGATSTSARLDRREPLASIVHLTDIHIIDGQTPGRVEFTDRYSDSPAEAVPFESAYRAQELQSAHVAEAMIRQINAIGAGPVTGRAYDIAISTGDNTDNCQQNELDWFITLLDGGTLQANSGNPDLYEGVMDTDAVFYDEHYWHPDDVRHPVTDQPDLYKRRDGFPDYPGLLEAAMLPFQATGLLGVPWYSCYGNHDGLIVGNFPTFAFFEAIAVGSAKITGLPGLTPGDLQQGLLNQDPFVLAALASAPVRPVTADPKRHFLTANEYIQRHVDSTSSPHGHGYTQEHADTGQLYYSFDVTEEILGISLDTVNKGGYAEGSVDPAQFAWLEQELVAVHSRHLDGGGSWVDAGNQDRLVVIFSHHNIPTINNPIPDPADPLATRVMGDELEALLHRFPNVVLWVNGHSHVNRVWARPDASGQTGGFWEMNTASHIDAPQQARIVELVDNHDGTLSVFGTLVDHAGPTSAPAGSTDVLSLAAISRELSYNDAQQDVAGALGEVADRNVELIVARPFERSVPAVVRPTEQPTTPDAVDGAQEGLPATGAGALGVVAGSAAIAAAAVLRTRGAQD